HELVASWTDVVAPCASVHSVRLGGALAGVRFCLAARGHFGGSGDFGGVPKGVPTMKNHRSILFTLTSLFMIAPLGCDEPLELDAEAELDDREVELSGESPSADAALFEADLAEADQVNVGELGQPSCSTVNLDSDSTCRMLDGVSQCGQQIAGYNGEYGWTQWWWPTHYQHYCHSPNNKWRLYWYQPWVKAPANRPAIRLRYQGPNPC